MPLMMISTSSTFSESVPEAEPLLERKSEEPLPRAEMKWGNLEESVARLGSRWEG